MAEKYITKKKKVKGEVKETTYRIDADFTPKAIGEISNEFIENYCVEKNQIDWLVNAVNTPSYEVKRKDGTIEEVACENYPFVNLRRDFAKKFFPNIIGGTTPTAETFKDKINRLYGKK